MAFTRVVAYGAKWYRWYSRQQYKIRAKSIPIRFRERKLIDSEATAEYSTHYASSTTTIRIQTTMARYRTTRLKGGHQIFITVLRSLATKGWLEKHPVTRLADHDQYTWVFSDRSAGGVRQPPPHPKF